jgi:glycosyltransferase involved in cell wall biosynthesis
VSEAHSDDGPILIATMVDVDTISETPDLANTTRFERRRTGTDGVHTHVAQVAALLSQHRQQVRVVSPHSWSPRMGWALRAAGWLLRRCGRDNGVRVERFVHRFLLTMALRREFRKQYPAVVYAQDPRSAYAALAVRGVAAVPVVMVVHYNISQAEELVIHGLIRRDGAAYRAIRRFDEDLVPRLDGLVFVSAFMRAQLQQHVSGTTRIPSVIVPNFLRRIEAQPSQLPMSDCISVGNLVPRKNQAYLLDVVAAAKRNGHRYTLSLVGDGTDREPLERMACKLGIADQVLFLGSRSDVDLLLPRHRVLVHSAVMENCPFALIEAFRSGLPVVAGAVGGIPEVVASEGAGRFWDLDDPAAGARVLSGLLEDGDALSRAAAAATSRFATTFDADVSGPRLVAFLAAMRADA